MARRAVFDGPSLSNNRPSPIADVPELVLSDKVLQTAYDVVKEVLLHLQKIEELNSSINNIHHLIPLLDEIQVKGTKGLSGGGGLADEPTLRLDLSTLPAHSGPLDTSNDIFVFRNHATGEENTLTVSELRTALIKDLTELSGMPEGSTDLGSFAGSALPEGLTVKAALQALASYTEMRFENVDARIDSEVSNAISSTLSNIRSRLISLEASLLDVTSQLSNVTDRNFEISYDVEMLISAKETLQNLATVLQSAIDQQQNKLNLLQSDLLDRAPAWLVNLLSGRLDGTELELEDTKEILDWLTQELESKAAADIMLDVIERVTEAEAAWAGAQAALAALRAELVTMDEEFRAFLGSEASSNARDLANRIKNLSTHAMIEGAIAFGDRREIVAQQDAMRASFSEDIDILLGNDSVLAQRQTALEADTAAAHAAVSTLETAMATMEDAFASEISTLTAETAATKAQLETVSGTVASLDEALSTTVTTLQSELAGKASSSVVEALSTQVTEQGGKITSVADKLTEVFAGDQAGNEASVRVRMAAQTAPSGAQARFGIEVKANSSGSFQTAGMFMDVMNNGTSRIAFQTSKFFIYDGSGSSMITPFTVSGNTVYMQNVYMDAAYITGYIYANRIYAPKLDAISATLGAVNISEAIVGTLTVDSVNIAGNAVTTQAGAETSGGITISDSWTNVISVAITWTNAQSLFIFYQFRSGQETEVDIQLRSAQVTMSGYTKTITPQANTFTVMIDMFSGSQLPSGSNVNVWMRRTTSGSVTIFARKLVVLVAKR